MERRQPDYFVPALIGGLLAGVASAIPFLNCLCCLWVIGGAMLSAYLLSERNPAPLRTGDGLLVGVLSGIFGGVIHAILKIPFGPIYLDTSKRFLASLSRFVQEIPSNWEEQLETIASLTPSLFVLDLLLSCLLFAFFGAIGGLIGISLYGQKTAGGVQNEKKTAQDQSDNQPGV